MKAGVSTFFSSAGMMIYDFGNHLTLGSLDSERYNAQVESQGERLYNVAKNLGYSDESIANGYGLTQALVGEVVGTNALAEAGTGYDLGNNTMLDGWQRAQKAAMGTSQVAFTSAGVLRITGVNPKLTSENFTYSRRVAERALADPHAHNFPYSFDKIVLSTKPIKKLNGYKMYQHEGYMNNKRGMFEIGVTKDRIIDHRFFRPDKGRLGK
jgi:hypothetical protein